MQATKKVQEAFPGPVQNPTCSRAASAEVWRQSADLERGRENMRGFRRNLEGFAQSEERGMGLGRRQWVETQG